MCVIVKFLLPFWLHVCPGKTCIWQNQRGIILLEAGEVPTHRQCTAEVPLRKGPNPQMLKQGPAMLWRLIEECNLPICKLRKAPAPSSPGPRKGKSSPEENVCRFKKQSILYSIPESHRLFLVLTPNHNRQTLRIPVHVPRRPSFPTICS